MITDPIYLGLPPSPERLLIKSGERAGFHFGEKGAHTSRTMMLNELTSLMQASGPNATRDEYRRRIIEDNCLGKRTNATRRLTNQRLSELYALDSRVMLFRVMRQLWADDDRGRPLLALLLALARDPLLRLTAPTILRLRPGEELGRQSLTDALSRGTGSRFNEAVLDKVVRNAAASWTQSGHLEGRGRKIRRVINPTSAVVTFALMLGYALGARGGILFETLWSKLLDVGTDEMVSLAMDAKRIGYIHLRVTGGIVEISPARILTAEERRLVDGPG